MNNAMIKRMIFFRILIKSTKKKMPRLQIQCYCYSCRDDLIVSYEGSAQKEISCVSSCNRSLCETAINKKINQKKQMNTNAKKKWRQTKIEKKKKKH